MTITKLEGSKILLDFEKDIDLTKEGNNISIYPMSNPNTQKLQHEKSYAEVGWGDNQWKN